MPSTKDWQSVEAIQALVFGKYKSGKTWGALTFPRPVVFDFDKGIATARNPEFVKRYGLRDIRYEQFVEEKLTGGVPKNYNAIDLASLYFDEWMKPKGNWKGEEVGRDMFDTFIVDSGTTLSDLAMSKGVILLGTADYNKMSLTYDVAKKKGLLIPKIQDYGAERSIVTQFVDMVKSAAVQYKKNFIFICHELELTDDNGSTIGIVPLLTGKGKQQIPLMFDEVWHTKTVPKGQERTYVIETNASGLLAVGSRYGVPDGTVWEYDAVKKALDDIRAEQLKQVQSTEEKSA